MTPGVVSRKNGTRGVGIVLARNYSRRHFTAIALVYTAIAVIMTWPLMRHPSSSVASDLGDPLFNSWVLMWTAGQVLAALRGDLGALTDYWNGNIFYPEPLHDRVLGALDAADAADAARLRGEAATSSSATTSSSSRRSSSLPWACTVRPRAHRAPARGVSRGPRVRVRAVPPRPVPAPAGHVDRLDAAGAAGSAQILRRPAKRARSPAARARSWFKNLSCGYYMLFFAPLFAAYCLYEMVRRRLAGSMAHLAEAGHRRGSCWSRVVAVLAAVPASSRTAASECDRSDETVMFSADTHAFVTIAPARGCWARSFLAIKRPRVKAFRGSRFSRLR